MLESTESLEALETESTRQPCDPSLQKVLEQLEVLQQATDSIAYGQNRIELVVCQIQNEIQVRTSPQIIHTDPMNSNPHNHNHGNLSSDLVCRSSWTKNQGVLALDSERRLSHRTQNITFSDPLRRSSMVSPRTSGTPTASGCSGHTKKELDAMAPFCGKPIIRQRSFFEELPTHSVARVFRTQKTRIGLTTSKTSWIAPLHPDSKYRTALDLTGIVSLLYDSVWVPYQLAWEVTPDGWRLVVAWILALFWTLELLLGFITGFQKQEVARVEMGLAAIFKNYVKSLDFLLNLVAVFADWTNLAIEALMAEGGGQERSLLRFVRLVKVTKVLRVAAVLRAGKLARVREHFMSALRRWGIDEQIYFVESLMRLLFLILWMNHVGGCIWYVTGKTASQIWYIDNIAEESTGLGLVIQDVANADEYQYLLSVYWSITSMFSGASIMSPTNTSELYLTIFYIIFGTLFGSSLISCMAAMLMDLQMTNKERQERLKELRKYLYQHRVEAMLAVPIEKEVVARMGVQRPLAEKDVGALAHLSPSTRCELWYTIYGPLIMGSLFFGTVSSTNKSIIKDICSAALSHTACTAGATIFACSEESKGAYIVSWGSLEYRSSIDDENPDEVKCGQWISEIALWSEWTHQGWLDSSTNAEVLEISPEGMLKVLLRHPATAMLARDYSSAMMLAVQTSPPDSISDLRLPVDHATILPFMCTDSRACMSQGALELLKQHSWSFLRGRGMHELVDEVKQGKSDLTVDRAGNVTRSVSRVALRLLRTGDGRLLAQVGKCLRGQLEAECVLPGTKVRGGEMPDDALQRLLREKLGHLSTCVIPTRQVYSVDEHVDAGYGIQTRYQHTTYHAELCSACSLPQQAQPLRTRVPLRFSQEVDTDRLDRLSTETVPVGWVRSALRRSSRRAAARMSNVANHFAGLDFFALHDEAHEGTFVICSWLSPEDFEWFSAGSGGEAILKEYVSYLDVQEMARCQMIRKDTL